MTINSQPEKCVWTSLFRCIRRELCIHNSVKPSRRWSQSAGFGGRPANGFGKCFKRVGDIDFDAGAIKSFEAQIKAADIALEGVQREASVGSRTVLDVLDAEQELLDAKVSLVRAQRDEVVASFQLKEAIGQLTAENLSLQVDLFDPDAYYRHKNKFICADVQDRTTVHCFMPTK